MSNKYQQVVKEIEIRAATGKWQGGMRLPSIRQLSEEFNCNKATVIRAYQELETKHLIFSVPKSGYYLVDRKQDTSISDMPSVIDFSAANPDSEVLPYLDIQHCLNQAIEVYKEKLFTYSEPQGLLSLRESLAKKLQEQQVFTSAAKMVITSGSQQTLNILVTMPFPNGKSNILIEQPTYAGITQSCRLANITALGIARTHRGFDFETLERIFQNGNIKFFYTIPRFHNPLGTSLTNAEKKRLVTLALRYDVYIVEDDYLADLETDPKADPVFAFDHEDHVIYLKSFSKTLLPGIRIGMTVLPQLLIPTFKSFKKAADLNTSILSQGALQIYISSGMLEKHHQKIKTFYQKRMDALKTACLSHLTPNVHFEIPKTGFFTTLELPIPAQTLVEKAKIQNIRLLSVQSTMAYLPEFESNRLIRLSISNTSQPQIEAGIATIAKILNDIPLNPGLSPPEESVLV